MEKKRYLAYDDVNSEYESFDTIGEARNWLTEGILCDEGYTGDISTLKNCKIYELKEIVEITVTERPDIYDEESWPYTNDVDEVWMHEFKPVE